MQLYGKWGKFFVAVALVGSQVGFCCAYVYYIMCNYAQILRGLGVNGVDRMYFAIFTFWLFSALCFVRKIQVFSAFHVFSDIMILMTVLVVVGFGISDWDKDRDLKTIGVDPINKSTWTEAIGFSIYAFEGIGMVLPIQDITKNPESYWKIVVAVIVSVGVLFITFGVFTSFAWGNKQTTPLITDLLPNYVDKDGNITYFVYIVLFLFSLNLVFSFPLQIYPVEIIFENLLFDGWPKSRKRQMFKNMSRSVIVFFVVCMTIMLKDKFDKFLAILGSVTCTPMAFTFPAMFHLKAVA